MCWVILPAGDSLTSATPEPHKACFLVICLRRLGAVSGMKLAVAVGLFVASAAEEVVLRFQGNFYLSGAMRSCFFYRVT